MPRMQIIRRGADPRRDALAKGISEGANILGKGILAAGKAKEDKAADVKAEAKEAQAQKVKDGQLKQEQEDRRQKSVEDLYDMSKTEGVTDETMKAFIDMDKKRYPDTPDEDYDVIRNSHRTSVADFSHAKAKKQGDELYENTNFTDNQGNLYPNAQQKFMTGRDQAMMDGGRGAGEQYEKRAILEFGPKFFTGSEDTGDTKGFMEVPRIRDMTPEQIQQMTGTLPPHVQGEVPSQFRGQDTTGVDDLDKYPYSEIGSVPEASDASRDWMSQSPTGGVDPRSYLPQRPADVTELAAGAAPPLAADEGGPSWYQMLNSKESDVTLFAGPGAAKQKKTIIDSVNSMREKGAGWEEIKSALMKFMPNATNDLLKMANPRQGSVSYGGPTANPLGGQW